MRNKRKNVTPRHQEAISPLHVQTFSDGLGLYGSDDMESLKNELVEKRKGTGCATSAKVSF